LFVRDVLCLSPLFKWGVPKEIDNDDNARFYWLPPRVMLRPAFIVRAALESQVLEILFKTSIGIYFGQDFEIEDEIDISCANVRRDWCAVVRFMNEIAWN